jgi:hypothetical protein
MQFVEDFFEDEDITECIMCLRFFCKFDTEIVAEILEFVLFEFWKEIAREAQSTNRRSHFDTSSFEDIDIIVGIVSNERIGFEEVLEYSLYQAYLEILASLLSQILWYDGLPSS